MAGDLMSFCDLTVLHSSSCHRGKQEDYSLVEYNAEKSRRSIPTFQRCVLPQSLPPWCRQYAPLKRRYTNITRRQIPESCIIFRELIICPSLLKSRQFLRTPSNVLPFINPEVHVHIPPPPTANHPIHMGTLLSTVFMWLWTGSRRGSCRHGNEPLSYTKGWATISVWSCTHFHWIS
jgi:hypothetical protein